MCVMFEQVAEVEQQRLVLGSTHARSGRSDVVKLSEYFDKKVRVRTRRLAASAARV
jgi:hypothetical protein